MYLSFLYWSRCTRWPRSARLITSLRRSVKTVYIQIKWIFGRWVAVFDYFLLIKHPVAFELMTGNPPFSGSNIGELFQNIQFSPVFQTRSIHKADPFASFQFSFGSHASGTPAPQCIFHETRWLVQKEPNKRPSAFEIKSILLSASTSLPPNLSSHPLSHRSHSNQSNHRFPSIHSPTEEVVGTSSEIGDAQLVSLVSVKGSGMLRSRRYMPSPSPSPSAASVEASSHDSSCESEEYCDSDDLDESSESSESKNRKNRFDLSEAYNHDGHGGSDDTSEVETFYSLFEFIICYKKVFWIKVFKQILYFFYSDGFYNW